MTWQLMQRVIYNAQTKRVGPTLVIVCEKYLLKTRDEFRLNQRISMLLGIN